MPLRVMWDQRHRAPRHPTNLSAGKKTGLLVWTMVETELSWVFFASAANKSVNLLLQIALYGKNFCESTKDAFYLLMRNILK